MVISSPERTVSVATEISGSPCFTIRAEAGVGSFPRGVTGASSTRGTLARRSDGQGGRGLLASQERRAFRRRARPLAGGPSFHFAPPRTPWNPIGPCPGHKVRPEDACWPWPPFFREALR